MARTDYYCCYDVEMELLYHDDVVVVVKVTLTLMVTVVNVRSPSCLWQNLVLVLEAKYGLHTLHYSVERLLTGNGLMMMMFDMAMIYACRTRRCSLGHFHFHNNQAQGIVPAWIPFLTVYDVMVDVDVDVEIAPNASYMAVEMVGHCMTCLDIFSKRLLSFNLDMLHINV